MTWEAIVVDGLKTVLESPEGQTEAKALITAGEGDLTALVTNAVKNVKTPGGLAGIAVGALETPIVNAILANFKADPQALLTAIDGDVDAWAKSLGG